MLLTYRGVKYDKDAALRQHLLNKLKKEERLNAEIKHERKNLSGIEIF